MEVLDTIHFEAGQFIPEVKKSTLLLVHSRINELKSRQNFKRAQKHFFYKTTIIKRRFTRDCEVIYSATSDPFEHAEEREVVFRAGGETSDNVHQLNPIVS